MSDTLATPQQKNFLMPGSRPLLVLIALCGLLLRIGGLNKPVEYDEAYTVVEFSSRSWWAVISDYSLPNNHILHSLLVRASLLSFGQHAWSIRLPALLAGLGMIVAAYFLGKALYSRETGLVAAALVAYFPEMLRFSTTARGYTLVGLFSLLIFWLAQRAVRQPGPRISGWGRLLVDCA
ncbi:MAG: glycosyltransferase family 39 protein [Chloroflexi bacterium]|nr:glycosyltransferase family 39 protein [Chloroflexota bacterium]